MTKTMANMTPKCRALFGDVTLQKEGRQYMQEHPKGIHYLRFRAPSQMQRPGLRHLHHSVLPACCVELRWLHRWNEASASPMPRRLLERPWPPYHLTMRKPGTAYQTELLLTPAWKTIASLMCHGGSTTSVAPISVMARESSWLYAATCPNPLKLVWPTESNVLSNQSITFWNPLDRHVSAVLCHKLAKERKTI